MTLEGAIAALDSDPESEEALRVVFDWLVQQRGGSPELANKVAMGLVQRARKGGPPIAAPEAYLYQALRRAAGAAARTSREDASDADSLDRAWLARPVHADGVDRGLELLWEQVAPRARSRKSEGWRSAFDEGLRLLRARAEGNRAEELGPAPAVHKRWQRTWQALHAAAEWLSQRKLLSSEESYQVRLALWFLRRKPNGWQTQVAKGDGMAQRERRTTLAIAPRAADAAEGRVAAGAAQGPGRPPLGWLDLAPDQQDPQVVWRRSASATWERHPLPHRFALGPLLLEARQGEAGLVLEDLGLDPVGLGVFAPGEGPLPLAQAGLSWSGRDLKAIPSRVMGGLPARLSVDEDSVLRLVGQDGLPRLARLGGGVVELWAALPSAVVLPAPPPLNQRQAWPPGLSEARLAVNGVEALVRVGHWLRFTTVGARDPWLDQVQAWLGDLPDEVARVPLQAEVDAACSALRSGEEHVLRDWLDLGEERDRWEAVVWALGRRREVAPWASWWGSLQELDRAMEARPALRAEVALLDEGWGRAVADLQPDAWWVMDEQEDA